MLHVSATMCMVPDRYPQSLQCILSLVDQIDRIYLCLNGFDSVPDQLRRDWIEIIHVGENLGSIGRFTQLPPLDCHLLPCDDDLVYPRNYVTSMRERSEALGGALVTHHGKLIVDGAIVSKAHWQWASDYDGEIEIPGCGVSFIPREHANRLRATQSILPNQSDLHLGVMAVLCGAKIYSVPHPVGYFVHVPPPQGSTIWEQETSKLDQVATFNELKTRYGISADPSTDAGREAC